MQGLMIALQYHRKAGKGWFGASGAAISGALSAVSLSPRAGYGSCARPYMGETAGLVTVAPVRLARPVSPGLRRRMNRAKKLWFAAGL